MPIYFLVEKLFWACYSKFRFCLSNSLLSCYLYSSTHFMIALVQGKISNFCLCIPLFFSNLQGCPNYSPVKVHERTKYGSQIKLLFMLSCVFLQLSLHGQKKEYIITIYINYNITIIFCLCLIYDHNIFRKIFHFAKSPFFRETIARR